RVDVRVGGGGWAGEVKNCGRFGGAAPVTCGCARVMPVPWPPMLPHALPVPEYRLALRMGSVPTPRGGMQVVFPWRQSRLCGDWIASVKLSLPERLPIGGPQVQRDKQQ